MYYVNPRETLIDHAIKLAKEQNLKVIVLTSASSYEYLMGDEVAPEVDYRGAEAPDTLIGLINQPKVI